MKAFAARIDFVAGNAVGCCAAAGEELAGGRGGHGHQAYSNRDAEAAHSGDRTPGYGCPYGPPRQAPLDLIA